MTDFTDFQLMVLEKDRIECADVIALLGDYQDNELPPTLRARLDAHIADCSYCSEMQAGYSLTVELAGELEDEPIPVDVQNRLRSSLNQRLGLSLGMVE